jgi:hypothetical protein
MRLRLREQGVVTRYGGELANVRVGKHDVHLARRRDHHACMLLSVRRHACVFVYVHKLIIAFKFSTKNKNTKIYNKVLIFYKRLFAYVATHGHILLIQIKNIKNLRIASKLVLTLMAVAPLATLASTEYVLSSKITEYHHHLIRRIVGIFFYFFLLVLSASSMEPPR